MDSVTGAILHNGIIDPTTLEQSVEPARGAVISWIKVGVLATLLTEFVLGGVVFGVVGPVECVVVLGLAVLGAIVGTAVYRLTSLLKRLLNYPGETRKRNDDGLDLFADERRRDKIFGVQRIQSFLPDSDESLHH